MIVKIIIDGIRVKCDSVHTHFVNKEPVGLSSQKSDASNKNSLTINLSSYYPALRAPLLK